MSDIPNWADVGTGRYIPSHEQHPFYDHIQDMEGLKALIAKSQAPMLTLQAAGVDLGRGTFSEQQERAHRIVQKVRHLKEVSIDDLAAAATSRGISTIYGEFSKVQQDDVPFRYAAMVFGIETDALLLYATASGNYSLPNAAFMEQRDALEERGLKVTGYDKRSQERFNVPYLPLAERPRLPDVDKST